MYPAWTQQCLEDEALEGIIKLFPQISKDQVILELFSFASLKLLLNYGKNVDSSCNNCKICSPMCVLKILTSNKHYGNACYNLYGPYESSARSKLFISYLRGHFQS